MNGIIAIVVTYNRLDKLKNCIKALKSQTKQCDIVVIDNASTDQTNDYLCTESAIQHIRMKVNIGGAGGFSEGIKFAFKNGYSYAWIMDDDCIPTSTALEEFIVAHNELNGNYGWLSSLCYWKDGKFCSMNIQMESPFRHIKSFDKNYIQAKMASFVSLFINLQKIYTLGLPISEFVIWSDDWEYTRRISIMYSCYVVTSSKVIHDMDTNQSVNISTDTQDRIWRYLYFYRNDVFLYRREGIIGWCWVLLKDIYHTFLCVVRKKPRLIATIWRGFLNGCRFYPCVDLLDLEPENCSPK